MIKKELSMLLLPAKMSTNYLYVGQHNIDNTAISATLKV